MHFEYDHYICIEIEDIYMEKNDWKGLGPGR